MAPSRRASPGPQLPEAEVPRSVPAAVRARYADVTRLTDDACRRGLNEEYAQLARRAAEVLSRKRPSPLLGGRAPGWACGTVYALGQVNFLLDRASSPYLPPAELFGVSAGTGGVKAKKVRTALKTRMMDPEWTVPSRMGQNLMAWLVMIDGLMVDARTLSPDFQEALVEAGLIPYVHDGSEDDE